MHLRIFLLVLLALLILAAILVGGFGYYRYNFPKDTKGSVLDGLNFLINILSIKIFSSFAYKETLKASA